MAKIDESILTKMEVRKLNALRKSIGDKLGDKAFAAWYAEKPKQAPAAKADKNAQAIINIVEPLILEGKIRLPQGGYMIRRGRGRVIVERPTSS